MHLIKLPTLTHSPVPAHSRSCRWEFSRWGPSALSASLLEHGRLVGGGWWFVTCQLKKQMSNLQPSQIMDGTSNSFIKLKTANQVFFCWRSCVLYILVLKGLTVVEKLDNGACWKKNTKTFLESTQGGSCDISNMSSHKLTEVGSSLLNPRVWTHAKAFVGTVGLLTRLGLPTQPELELGQPSARASHVRCLHPEKKWAETRSIYKQKKQHTNKYQQKQ